MSEIIVEYLGHKFNDGQCVYCKASEKAVREFRAACHKPSAPVVSGLPSETAVPSTTPSAMIEYLGHTFNDGQCVYCKASLKAIREFRVKCHKAPAPVVSELPLDTSSPSPLDTTSPSATPSASTEDRKQIQQSGGMDFHKLASFILALGILLFCIGAGIFINNQPISQSQIQGQSGNSIQGMIADANQMERNMQTQSENENRSFKRQGALKWIGAGAFIIFAGVAIMLSVRKPKSNDTVA